jgi:hypothetical protein
MLALKWLLLATGAAMFGTAGGVVAYDVFLAMQFRKLVCAGEVGAAGKAAQHAGLPAKQAGTVRPIRWPSARKKFAWRSAPFLGR